MTGIAGRGRASLATVLPCEDEEKQMRVESHTYRLDMSKSPHNDLRMQASFRGSARLTGRFQEAMRLDYSSAAPATNLPTNDTIKTRSHAMLALRQVQERSNHRSLDGRVPWRLRPEKKGAIRRGRRGIMPERTGRLPGWTAPRPRLWRPAAVKAPRPQRWSATLL